MRATTFLAFCCGLCLFAFEASAKLLISEYIEGSGNNKAIEIWNNSDEAVDLTGVQLEVYIDGSVTPTTTIFLITGYILEAGDVFVLSHPLATFADSADQTSFSAAWDGNDTIVLRASGVIKDSIGQIGFAPPTEWGTNDTSTANNTLRRETGNLVGDTDPFDVYDPSIAFEGLPTDDFSNLGIAPVPLLFNAEPQLAVSNDFCEVYLTGPVNNSVILDVSSDLQNWTAIQTNVMTTNGIQISLPIETNSVRFFRARIP